MNGQSGKNCCARLSRAAQSKLAKLEVEFAEKGSTQLEAGKVTFRQLAQYCKDNKYTEAQYDENGTKISGVRSVKAAHIAVDHLVEFFGNRNIQKIQFDDLEKYKKHRLSQKKKNGKPIKLATATRQNDFTRCRSSLQHSIPVNVIVRLLTSCVGNTLILRTSRSW